LGLWLQNCSFLSSFFSTGFLRHKAAAGKRGELSRAAPVPARPALGSIFIIVLPHTRFSPFLSCNHAILLFFRGGFRGDLRGNDRLIYAFLPASLQFFVYYQQSFTSHSVKNAEK